MLKKLSYALALVICLTAYGIAQTLQFSGQSPACTATPPAQAVALGYTKLVYCNDLFSNAGVVDVNNTTNPWFLFYTTSFGLTIPAGDIANDGTGLEITTIPNDSYGGLVSAILGQSSYAGNIISGGFYIEVDAKFDSSVCLTTPNTVPAFWLGYPKAAEGSGTTDHFAEIDIFEWRGCANFMTVHDWTGNTNNCDNSNNSVSLTPGTGYNTYGVAVQTSVSGGGTGLVEWYFNNTAKITVTFSPGGKPSPAGTCPTGAFSTIDTQPWTFFIGAGTGDPTWFRHLHIWQAP